MVYLIVRWVGSRRRIPNEKATQRNNPFRLHKNVRVGEREKEPFITVDNDACLIGSQCLTWEASLPYSFMRSGF